MKEKTKLIIYYIIGVIIVLFLTIILVWGFYRDNEINQGYIQQCKDWGYDTFKNNGLYGQYCLWDGTSIEVIANNNNLWRIEK